MASTKSKFPPIPDPQISTYNDKKYQDGAWGRDNQTPQPITKKQFIEIIKFCSGFGGFTDLANSEVQEELWQNYEREQKQIE